MKKIKVLLIAYNFYPLLNAESLVATRLINVPSEKLFFDVFCGTLDINQKRLKGKLNNNIKLLYQKDKPQKRFKKILYFFKVLRKAKLKKYDLIYSRSTPELDNVLGLILKLRNKKPWLVHFSDPWVDSPYRNKHWLTEPIFRFIERKIFQEADMVTVTTENLKLLLIKRYPFLARKIEVMPHPMEKLKEKEPTANKKIVVSHIGEFYGPRNPYYFLKLLEKINIPNIKINFVGGNKKSDEIMKNIDKYKIAKKIKFHGMLSFEEAQKIGLRSDYLVLIEANLPKKSLCLPSKLMDYLSLRKTIICITNKNSPINNILKEKENSIIFFEDSFEKNKKKLQNLLKSKWENEFFLEKYQQYNAPYLNKKLHQIISEIVARKSCTTKINQ